MILVKRNLLRYKILFQVYNDFFTYGYEESIGLTYRVCVDDSIEVIAALYYLYYKKFIFFSIDNNHIISAYILGPGIDEIECIINGSGDLLLSQLQGQLLKPIMKKETIPSKGDDK